MTIISITFNIIDPYLHKELKTVSIGKEYLVLGLFGEQVLINDDLGSPLGIDVKIINKTCRINKYDTVHSYVDMVVKHSSVKKDSGLFNFTVGNRYAMLYFNHNKGLIVNNLCHVIEFSDSVIKNNFAISTATKRNPRVLNKHHGDASNEAIYIGRPSKWGNPFVVGKHGERGECVDLYRNWIKDQPELISQIKNELKGKDLVCFCAPKKCHGDVIIEIANS